MPTFVYFFHKKQSFVNLQLRFVMYQQQNVPLLQGVMSNGPARQAGIPQTLQQAGETSGDPCEISTVRREVE